MSAQSPAAFRLTLAGPGVEVDKEVGQEAALAIVAIALGGPIPVTPNESDHLPRLSLREFIDAKGVRSNHEKIAAFTGYLRDYDGQEDVARDDIKSCFKSAGEAMPGNYPRDFNAAIQAGLIAEDPKKPGRYYLTRKGDETVGRNSD